MRGPGTNTGHGHVWKRPDGVRARCGGVPLCKECQKDFALINAPAQPDEVSCEVCKETMHLNEFSHLRDCGRDDCPFNITAPDAPAIREARDG